MRRGVSKALSVAVEVYRRNRLRINKLQENGLLSAEEARRDRAAVAGALLAALALDEGRGRGAPKGGRVVVGGDAFTPARAVPYKKPSVKDGRGRQRQYRDGFEYEVQAAVDQAMEESGGSVREVIMLLLKIEGSPTSEQEKDIGAMRALYYRAKRAKTGDL